jgi:hypothetical protein
VIGEQVVINEVDLPNIAVDEPHQVAVYTRGETWTESSPIGSDGTEAATTPAPTARRHGDVVIAMHGETVVVMNSGSVHWCPPEVAK